jgi:long-subunit fatty acid transport protein
VRLSVAVTTLAAAATVAGTAAADGGYYGGALGARAAGRAGAFTARADDPTAVHYNPAGLATLGGTMIMVGNRVSYNGSSYTRAPTLDWGAVPPDGTPSTVTFSKVSNQTPWQAAEPLILAASNLGLRDFGFGAGVFASPGASRVNFPSPANISDPPGSAGQRYMMLGREAIILNYTAAAAWKFRDLFGIGVALQAISVPRLDYSLMVDGTTMQQNVNPVRSPLDMVASTSGSDWFTFNAIVGAWFRPVPSLQFGAAGQVVPNSITTNSTLKVTPLDQPDPDMPTNVVVLTRDDLPANDVTVVLPLPLSARVGARYRGLAGMREVFDVELDVEYETWSRVNEFTVATRGLNASYMGSDNPLGDIRVPKAWRDTIAVKLGGDVAVIPDRLALRAGGFYETAVAPSSHANADFAGGKMFGGTIGASYLFGAWEVALGYQFRRQSTVTVSEDAGRVYQQVPATACPPPYTSTLCHPAFTNRPPPVVNAGTYDATFHHLSLAAIYRFGR